MKILQINNRARAGGGMDNAVDDIRHLLRSQGMDVSLLEWDSGKIGAGLPQKIAAFGTSLYSFSAAKKVSHFIRSERPDIVLVHNYYPLVSPSVLTTSRKMNVPAVLICHNNRLTCPTYLHLSNGLFCDLCTGGREYWCILKNCRRNFFESTAHALHSFAVRKSKVVSDNVTIFVCWTNTGRDLLLRAGFSKERIVVVPRLIRYVGPPVPDPTEGRYVGYAGRCTPEKGVDILLQAADRLPNITFYLAGNSSLLDESQVRKAKNVHLVGELDRPQLLEFYRGARFLVVPSLCVETFGAVAGEGQTLGLPVIASNRGGLVDVVDDGVTGLLVEAGNADDLAKKIDLLWSSPDLCRKMGTAARQKAFREYSEEVFFKRLISVFEMAVKLQRGL